MANVLYEGHHVKVFNPQRTDNTLVPLEVTSTSSGGTTSPIASLSHVSYTGTTEAGSAAVGTLLFTGACHAFNFFNKSSYTTVEFSLDGTVWLPMGAYGNWTIEAPGGFLNAAPFTELYHRRRAAGGSDWAVSAWEA